MAFCVIDDEIEHDTIKFHRNVSQQHLNCVDKTNYVVPLCDDDKARD